MSNVTSEIKVLRIEDVMRLLKLSKATIYRMMKLDEFPAPIKLGIKCVGWMESDILEWLQSRKNK